MAFTFTLTKTLILFLSFVILVHSTHAAHGPRTPEARVYSICKSTTSPGKCYRTILPEVVGLARFNLYKALAVEIIAAQKQVQKTYDLISTILAKPGLDRDMNETLTDCKEQYDNMFDSIDDSIKLVAQRNAGEARYKFSAVLSYHASCNDEFSGPSPIAAEAKDVYDLGGNCLDIMKAIEDRESRRRAVSSPLTGSSSPPTPCQSQVGLCG